MKFLSEKTVTLLEAGAVLIGGIFWLSALFYRQEAMAEKQQVQIQDIARLKDYNLEVLDRLARIETKMDNLVHQNKESK
jgi:hypothetical protein